MIRKTLAMRPDLLAVNAQLLADEKLEKALARDLYPRLVASVEGCFSDQRHGTSLRNYGLSIGITWDVFDGFEKFHRSLRQREQRKISLANLQGAELRAAGEVWSQFFTYRSAWEQVKSARSFLEAAEESFAATEISHRNGLGSFIDLLNAQNVLASARENVVAAESLFSVSLADLAYVTGDLEQFCTE
jgi:outer membrane protein TolC